MFTAFVDQIDEGVAVLVADRATMKVPVALLPRGAREGSYLRVSFEFDPAAEEKARARETEPRTGGSIDDGGDVVL